MFFVVCILLILIYRRRDPTNKNRIQRTCRYLGMTMLLWAVLASWLHGYSIFIISLPCFLLLCLLAVFFEQIATDWQSFFIVFLGGNLVLFFFLYVMRLSIPPLHFVLAYLVKKEFDACRRRLDKFEINFFILEHTVFFRVQYLFIACLLLDTMGWESMPIEKITIDPLFPMYAMSFVLFMAELMIRLLSQKYDVLKESIKGDVSVGY